LALQLLLETAAEICSVALCEDKEIISLRTSSEPRVHASALAVFVEEVLLENKITVRDLDAVAVSKGPGSYTGLRIGVATAKGLCYASGKPLIAIDTLQSMAINYLQKHPETEAGTLLVPMLDARRDEVYAAAYDLNGDMVLPVAAVILNEDSYPELQDRKVIVIGDGALKAEKLISQNRGFSYDAIFRHSAAGMAGPAYDKFMTKDFEDVAYFEPFYLKEFAGAVPPSSK
jgi:tRNA threonylcarbamoyladenosine biosynthesis protein TsaB